MADGMVKDCDRTIDEGTSAHDEVGDGCSGEGGECDDNDPSIYTDTDEICDDGVDQSCNGEIDEGCEEETPEEDVIYENSFKEWDVPDR